MFMQSQTPSPSFRAMFQTGARSISALDHAKIRRDPIQWPGGAYVAVTWTVIFEFFTGTGEADRALYGGRRGVWRLLDVFDLHEIKGSFLISGSAAERFPSAVKEIQKRGHEIAAYGYSSDRFLNELTPDEEKGDILKTLKALADVTETPPVGWVSPGLRPGDGTLAALAEEGMMWNGDFPNDDLPYMIQINAKPLLIIPYTRESDDREIYQIGGQLPSVWTQCFTDGLDVLCEEGLTHPKMLNASIHAHIMGRSVGTKAIVDAIRYAKALPKVWMTTRTEIAKWWLDKKYS
jgi:peptidoglycan/xylan/chitin deacetylase (PgdA/CDA1 family)